MADIKTPEERSLNMSKIRSRDTTPEVWLRKELFSRGYRYRKNVSNIPGHPDIWLARFNTAIFVHGCFWHRHGDCKYAYMPKSRVEFWTGKFTKNIERDHVVQTELQEAGVKMLIVWECTVKQMMKNREILENTIKSIEGFLRSDKMMLEL